MSVIVHVGRKGKLRMISVMRSLFKNLSSGEFQGKKQQPTEKKPEFSRHHDMSINPSLLLRPV